MPAVRARRSQVDQRVGAEPGQPVPDRAGTDLAEDVVDRPRVRQGSQHPRSQLVGDLSGGDGRRQRRAREQVATEAAGRPPLRGELRVPSGGEPVGDGTGGGRRLQH